MRITRKYYFSVLYSRLLTLETRFTSIVGARRGEEKRRFAAGEKPARWKEHGINRGGRITCMHCIETITLALVCTAVTDAAPPSPAEAKPFGAGRWSLETNGCHCYKSRLSQVITKKYYSQFYRKLAF